MMILHSRLYTKETVSYWLLIYLINDTVNCLWIMDSQAYMSIILTSIIYLYLCSFIRKLR